MTGTVIVEPGMTSAICGSQINGSGPPLVMATPGSGGISGWGI